MADRETALQAKRIGRWLLKWGSILFACGAGAMVLGLAAARSGSYSYASWPRMTVLVGMTVMLYLGFLPILMGTVLWIAGRVMEKKLNSRIKFR